MKITKVLILDVYGHFQNNDVRWKSALNTMLSEHSDEFNHMNADQLLEVLYDDDDSAIEEIMNKLVPLSRQYGITCLNMDAEKLAKRYVEDSTPVFYPQDSLDANKYLLESGDLLMSLTGNVGRMGLLPGEMCPAALNQRVACIRFNEKNVNRKFLFATFNSDSFEQDCMAFATGSAQKNMSTEWLKRYRIVLPPIEVQNAFSEVMERCENAKAAMAKSIAQLEMLSRSLMQKYFG